MKLPEQYDTMLGERGVLLSAGQKQRVCIARALIRNPKILILDEATAALDAQSEGVVQSALERASAGRTTITIAHRLSTVNNADVISVIDRGFIVESGTHSDLVAIEGGSYRTLIKHQRVEAQKAIEAKQDGATTGKIPSPTLAKVASTSLSHSVQVDGAVKGGEESTEAAVDKGIISRAFKTNRNEWLFILLGMIGAALNGAAFPAMAIVFSEVIEEILSENDKGAVTKYALLYVALGGISFLGNFLQHAMLGISGELMTFKLRRASFRALLKQDMGFFDMKENSLGALSTRLATEATQVKGITGDVLGTFAFGLSTVLTGFLIAYIACWRVALVVTTVFPLGAIAQMGQLKMMTGFDADSETRYAAAGTVASEAVDNFEIVASIGVQDVFMNMYNEEVDKTQENIDLNPDRVAALESPVIKSPVTKQPPRNPKQKQKLKQKQKPKPSSSQAPTPTANSNRAASHSFQPILKASYNRLPRNIKVRAGKLVEMNAFYEKVFTFLHAQDNAPVTSKTLMAAMGDKSMEKFEVLRALAVVTANKKGWQLTYPKS